MNNIELDILKLTNIAGNTIEFSNGKISHSIGELRPQLALGWRKIDHGNRSGTRGMRYRDLLVDYAPEPSHIGKRFPFHNAADEPIPNIVFHSFPLFAERCPAHGFVGV
jgi:hypothetical protein